MEDKYLTLIGNVITRWNYQFMFKIFEMMDDGALIIDRDETIVYVNRAYTEIFNVPYHRVIGQKVNYLEPNAKIVDVLRAGKEIVGLQTYVYSVGITVVASLFPLYQEAELIGAAAIFKNVTQVIKLTNELERTKGMADYLQEQLEQKEHLPLSFKEYIGQNQRLRSTLSLAAKVAVTDSTILIQGESGAGKEVLAKAIHNASRRASKPLIKLNCASIPETLLESELFGYVDGAFTGARKGGSIGKFELAHTGTIFLDEIGDASLGLQTKLLRVLQEREFERVGGDKTIKVDIRVITATNRDLSKMVAEGTFRRDLYYRLNIVQICLPPLRERKDDILTLANHFLTLYSEQVGKELIISPEVNKIFLSYEWPGNVRELQNVLEHASIISSGPQIEKEHLPTYLNGIAKISRAANSIEDSKLKATVDQTEKDLITNALLASNNNRSEAIRTLGISRRGFYNKLRRYGIELN